MKYDAITAKSRKRKQRLELMHQILSVVIILGTLLLLIDTHQFRGMFCVVFFLSAFCIFEAGITSDGSAKRRMSRNLRLAFTMIAALVLVILGIVSLIVAIKIK